ncbi:site-specific DNA-methyltransferase [Megasphaera elsdenii]|uniref:site-specific DNA-methyltransferase n=1 Tax=Megasphaera elsdenii TaxID=907 RepID=UPI004035BCE4
MDKMRMESEDIQQDNVAKIAALFPNCVTEARDEDGHLKKAINFEMLKQMLSDSVIDGDEAYEFTWVGKKASIVEANRPIRQTLRPVKEDSVNWDSTENLYIEGDNLEVLKLLQESYLGKVKMIYIDPPYNTGHDFVYPDSFIMNNEDYNEGTGYFDEDGNVNYQRENSASAGRYHSDWCSMIYSRLMLARNLLSEDGVIFISIDYNENFNMRSIANEIFGESHFIGEIYWESKTKSQNTKTSYNKLQPKEEMILVYSNQEKRRFHLIQLGEKEYPEKDDRGVYRKYPIEVMNANGVRGRKSMIFDITDGVSTVSPPAGKQWKLGQDQVAEYRKAGDLYIENGKAIIKMRPEYERNESTQPFWGFFSKEIGTAESAKSELKTLLPNNGFDTVKPVEMIRRLVYHATEKNDIILDFFSGSATTAHAVMQLNAEDEGHRKFIMVQLPEETDEKSEPFKAGYKNICEIGKERIRRAAKKIHEDNPDAKFDDGFRVLKLDDTNMKDVYYAAGDYTQDLVSMLESNVKPDRTDLDLLFGCLLDWGLPLSLPYTSETIDGCIVHTYNDGDLIACFDENVPESVIKAIAKRQPLRAVFRDSSFASSPEKINVGEIFKSLAPDTRVKVI